MRLAVGLAVLAAATVARADRPTDTSGSEMYRYLASDTVEHYDSTRFRVFFTRTGKNAVPSADVDGDGTPDRVRHVADLFEEVIDFYVGRGYRAPLSDATVPGDHGGDERFDVYLLDFGGSADGAFRRESCDAMHHCAGFVVMENDFKGYGYPSTTYADRVLVSHEFFHAVQAAYDDGETTIFSEGTAVWSTEQFDPTLSDLEGFVGGFLQRPDRSIFSPLPGPVDAFSYGSALFFQFLGEKLGPTIIRELWEAAEGGDDWFAAIDGVLQTHSTSFAEAFATFATWNLYTKARANPQKAYAAGAGYPLVRIDAQPLPAAVDSIRVFPSATIYYSLDPAGRTSIDVALLPTGNIDLGSLRVRYATRTGDAIADPQSSADGTTLTIPTAGADEIIVFVTNVAQSGESTRPSLCAGTTDEVAACKETFGFGTPKSHGCSTGAGASNGAGLVVLIALAARRRRRAA